MNRAALHPSPEDVELDASPLSVVPSLFLQLPHLEAIDEWEANQEQGTPPCLAIAIARVDRNLRPLLRRAPKSLIASIEQDLRESFTNDAESVYIETCDCWNRALLHVSIVALPPPPCVCVPVCMCVWQPLARIHSLTHAWPPPPHQPHHCRPCHDTSG
jgi:hypothetical protein